MLIMIFCQMIGVSSNIIACPLNNVKAQMHVQVAQHILSHSIPALEATRSPDCQLSFFEILSEAWQLHPQLQDQLRGPLLTLLGSPGAELRHRALAFWHSILPPSLPERLTSLITMTAQLQPDWVGLLQTYHDEINW